MTPPLVKKNTDDLDYIHSPSKITFIIDCTYFSGRQDFKFQIDKRTMVARICKRIEILLIGKIILLIENS